MFHEIFKSSSKRHLKNPQVLKRVLWGLFRIYLYIYICIYIYIYIGGWGCETNREIGFGSVVRASEAVCAREAIVLHIAGLGNGISPACRVPWPLVRRSHIINMPNVRILVNQVLIDATACGRC